MERHYKAFISYRHLPVEVWTAKALHRRIERYVIPAALRKNGEKRLGLVFRDQDELPISSNLTADIQQALDRSEYLIVICSPETAKSVWVLREISYFLEHHDRDHVLAVLCYGEPAEAFPPQLTELRDENGELIGAVEPLAANIVADTQAGRRRLFRVESLRILAALIGCPFDALYRREQRYRRRRIGAGLAAVGLVTAGFIGMLLDRNAKISEQLAQTQINESQALAALSENAYREGDYGGALDYALQALPQEDDDRPYVPQAEYAVSLALNLYRFNDIGYAQSLRQDTTISSIKLSEDGSRLLTLDATTGGLHLFDTRSGALLWTQMQEQTFDAVLLAQEDTVLLRSSGQISLLSQTDGAPLWSREDLSGFDLCACNAEERLALCAQYFAPTLRSDALLLLDLESGETLREYPLSEGKARLVICAALSPAGDQAAFLICDSLEDPISLLLLDLESGELRSLEPELRLSAGSAAFSLLFTPEGDLALACDDMDGDSYVRLYVRAEDWACRFNTVVEGEKVAQVVGSSVKLFSEIDLCEVQGHLLALGSKHWLHMIDLDSGELLWSQTLPAALLGGRLYSNGCLGLALSDGTVTFCEDDGTLASTQDVFTFRGNFETLYAAVQGPSYPESTFALVTESYRQQVSILRTLQNESMTPLLAPGDAARLATVSSPSGALTACLAYDAVGNPMRVTILHRDAELPLAEWPLDPDGGWGMPAKLCLNEAGVLFTPRQLLACRDGVSMPWGNGLVCENAQNAATGEVLSVCVSLDPVSEGFLLRRWRDGQEAEPLSLPEGCSPRHQVAELLSLSGEGRVLLRLTEPETGTVRLLCAEADGSWTELCAEGSLFTLAESAPRLVYLDGENRAHLLSLPDGTEQAVSEPLPAGSCKLLFCCDDGKLLVFSSGGALSLLDGRDASLLYSGEFGRLGLYFTDWARYNARLTDAGDRLLLFYDRITDNEPVCISLDAEHWACVGVYEGVSAYEAGTDTLLICPYLSPLCRSPLLTLSDMVAQAQGIMSSQAGEEPAP